MRVIKKSFVFICLLVVFCSTDLYALELQVLTEDFVPFNYMENGKITGFTVEIVEMLLDKTEIQPEGGKILMFPWKRAYKMALEGDNVLLFTTTRTTEREDLFRWVGPIYPREQWIFKLKKRKDIQIDSLEDAKRYTIVATRESANHKFLIKHGFELGKNLYTTGRWDTKIKLLLAGRVDLASYIPLELAYRLRQIGKEYDMVDPLFVASGELWYPLAFSKEISDEVVEQFQHALDAMKQDGTYDALLEKYMK